MDTMTERPRMTLGDEMKSYERDMRTFVPEGSYTLIRLDGTAFHTYTRGLKRPYDEKLMADMDATTAHLCNKLSTVTFGYVQSDEISLLLTPFTTENTQQWYGGAVQKMVSVSAGRASAMMTRLRPENDLAVFDARVFVLPNADRVHKYFMWRQRDAIKNAASMAAYAHFSEKSLQGANTQDRLDRLAEAGIDFESFPQGFRFGRVCTRQTFDETVTFTHRRSGETETQNVKRSRWVTEGASSFFDDQGQWVGPAFAGKD